MLFLSEMLLLSGRNTKRCLQQCEDNKTNVYVVVLLWLLQGQPIIDAARRMELRVGFDRDTSTHLLDAPVLTEDSSSELGNSCQCFFTPAY